MKRPKDIISLIFGITLILVGLAGFIYPEVTFKRTKMIKLGPVTVEEPKQQIFTIPPLVAGGVLAGGVILIYMSIKK